MANAAVIHYILEEVNVDYKISDLKSNFFNSAGSRPWDKGGPQSSRPFDGEGGAVFLTCGITRVHMISYSAVLLS